MHLLQRVTINQLVGKLVPTYKYPRKYVGLMNLEETSAWVIWRTKSDKNR